MPPRGRNFQPEEDDALAKAWLAVSTDASTNTDQTTEDFYGRIKEAFDAKMAAKPVAERTWQSLKSRFQTISHDCAKYSACVSRIQRLNESGGSNLDAYLSALSLYERDATSEGAKGAAAKFNFQSAFQTLKDSPNASSPASFPRGSQCTAAWRLVLRRPGLCPGRHAVAPPLHCPLCTTPQCC
eukprot:GHVU01211448.1.p1 GENE.GHVU01211448.1~~GHVU01211448.1.p1  ORF type:complete len:184 (+),score=13.34 GHVU01211448.1:225-776(+)